MTAESACPRLTPIGSTASNRTINNALPALRKRRAPWRAIHVNRIENSREPCSTGHGNGFDERDCHVIRVSSR